MVSTDQDKCTMDTVYATCQHVKLVKRESEECNAYIDGEKITVIKYIQQVPPGEHYLFGAKVINGSSKIVEFK